MTHPAPHRPGPAQQADIARAKRTARWVGLYVPLVLVASGTILALAWMPKMPDPAATHWGFSGGPDRFGSPWIYLWLTAGLGFSFVVLMWLMVEFGGRGGAMPLWSPFQRFMAAFAAGFAAFITMVNLISMGVQLDLSNAADAPGIGGLMGASFAVWIAVTAIAWLVQPKVHVRQPAAAPSAPLELAETERAVWFGEVRPSKPFLWIVGGSILLLTATTAALFLSPVDPAARWIMLGAVVLVAALALTSLWFGVRIDGEGLEARSFLGWPVFRLPAADVASVEAATIAPLAEFGGWGMRWAPGRFGLVMRSGEGIVATRRDGRIFALTVDDAEAGAALLATVSAAARRETGTAEDQDRTERKP